MTWRASRRHTWRSLLARVMLSSVLLAACSGDAMPHRETVTIIGPDETARSFRVEVARTDRERQRGLMGRTELAHDEGMLFLFPEITGEPLQFWMKNTPLPLDILFFDLETRLVSVAMMEPCIDDPCPFYRSTAPAQYALEVPAGVIAALGLRNDLAPEEREQWRLEMPEAVRL